MSKLDMYHYLPKKPLADGDNLYDTKQVSNNYRIIFKWLLNNSIDHKLSVVDSDTDWNDINNLSVYKFDSVEGPHAPEESEIGGNTGIVIGTSAGTGDQFQIAFTANGAAFRTLHSEWFYIGHGIPADVDVSKLVDQESLENVLQNYYTKPQTNEIATKIYDFVESSYYNKSDINNFQKKQAQRDSLQNNQIQRNREYTAQISEIDSNKASSNASNIVANSNSINSLSSSTSSGISSNASNEYLDSSITADLSYSASSEISQVSSNDNSEITSVSENTTKNSYNIDNNSGKIHYLDQSLNDDYAINSENIKMLSSTTSQEVSSNGYDIGSVSNVASKGRSYNFSYFTSKANSVDININSLTSLDISMNSKITDNNTIPDSSYANLNLYSTLDSNNNTYYLEDHSFGNTSSSTYFDEINSTGSIEISNTNSLAELNYKNVSVLNSYTFDATHAGIYTTSTYSQAYMPFNTLISSNNDGSYHRYRGWEFNSPNASGIGDPFHGTDNTSSIDSGGQEISPLDGIQRYKTTPTGIPLRFSDESETYKSTSVENPTLPEGTGLHRSANGLPINTYMSYGNYTYVNQETPAPLTIIPEQSLESLDFEYAGTGTRGTSASGQPLKSYVADTRSMLDSLANSQYQNPNDEKSYESAATLFNYSMSADGTGNSIISASTVNGSNDSLKRVGSIYANTSNINFLVDQVSQLSQEVSNLKNNQGGK